MKLKGSSGLRICLTLAILVTIFSLIFSGCGTIKSIAAQFDARVGETIRTMDNAIATLANQSADWQVVVANLEKDISKDAQSTIRTEIHDLTRSAVLSTGAEVRCNVEFMRIKIRRELIDLRNSLAVSFNNRIAKSPFANYQIALLPVEQIRPFICDIVPSSIDMSLDPERRTKIDIYGFDMRSLPISASYKTIGLFQARTAEGSGQFLNSMQNRMQEARLTIRPGVVSRNLVNVDSGRMRASIQTNDFELLSPSTLFDNSISQCISVISDFHAVLDLGGSCANIPPNTKELLLSWDNKIQSEIPVLTHEKVLECTTWTTPSISFKDLVFVPKKFGDGDTDFAGHGPCIRFSLHLNIDPTRKVLSAVVSMDAWECPDDFAYYREDKTEAWETKTFPLYSTNDPEATIIGFDLEPSIIDQYIDTNVQDETRGYGSAAPAYEIVFTGDTDGDDAGTRTRAVIKFNPIKITLQKCEYK